MKYNEAPQRRSAQEQALAIEDAEIRIIEICKEAALKGYTKDRFTREVNSVIKELKASLDNEELKVRSQKALENYALKTLEREVLIVREKAIFYAAVLVGLSKKEKSATAYFNNIIKPEYGEALVSSPRFLKYVSEANTEYFAYNNALPLNIYHKRYIDMVEQTLNELVAQDAKEDYSTNVSLRNIAETKVRLDDQLAKIDKLSKDGADLVYIKPHANCSKRCEKYQVGGWYNPSGLYSISGKKGVTPEGVPFIPLSEATDNPQDRYTTKAGKTYQNGCITGFNCRHQLIPYKPGAKPQVIPKEVIERRRKLEEKQRAFEREIRYYKRYAVQAKGVNPKASSVAKKKSTALNKKYQQFSINNKMAYYPERTKILDNE